jgi:cobalt/nickel transport protein
MSPKDRNVLVVGVIIALVISVLSPFIASTNPDGLDASADALNPAIIDSVSYFTPIMQDYSLPGMEDNPIGGVISLVVGSLIALGLAYGVFLLIKKPEKKEHA